jgi:hypothetical protein
MPISAPVGCVPHAVGDPKLTVFHCVMFEEPVTVPVKDEVVLIWPLASHWTQTVLPSGVTGGAELKAQTIPFAGGGEFITPCPNMVVGVQAASASAASAAPR